MIKLFIENIKNIDKFILKIMINGIKFSFILLIISLVLLISHIFYPISHLFYDSGLILFKTSLTYVIFCLVCGFVFDKLKKQMI